MNKSPVDPMINFYKKQLHGEPKIKRTKEVRIAEQVILDFKKEDEKRTRKAIYILIAVITINFIFMI